LGPFHCARACYDIGVPDLAIHGVLPAVVTPFRDDEEIDGAALRNIIDRLIQAGVNGLFAGGSSGEFCTLDEEERAHSLRLCMEAASGRVPVIGNVGSITTRETVRLARAAGEIGLDAIAIVTPYYLRPSQDELFEHYTAVCRAVRLPVLAYNFPQHGGVGLEPKTLGRVAAACENLIGIKDSGGSLEMAAAFLACAERDLIVLVGPEKLTLAALELGCAGVVTGCSNIVPGLFVELYRAWREGRQAEAVRLQGLVDELASTVPLHPFPSILKEGMEQCGIPAGRCRQPVGRVPAEAARTVSNVLAKLANEGFRAAAPKGVTA